ncbi:hypothetical protein P7C73_g3958, partial [Tremellales sp. Uapishka_1]
MFSSREGSSLRGRNVEDMEELEERGLLMRRESNTSDEGTRKRSTHGGTNGKVVVVDKLQLEEEKLGEGLNNRRDREAFGLLVVLYLLVFLPQSKTRLTDSLFSLQGIPLGLTFGTLPFLLKPHLSYSQLAVFALSTWPYSLKLLWSPIVDAWFVPKWGRRKSWIVPVQAIVGLGLWIIGGRVEAWLEEDIIDIRWLTMMFGSLIFAAATQDIAVDGWALTLLSPPNLSYASTAQTIGLGIGTASSFTVFLALNSVDFANKYFRSTPLPDPLVSLGSYMRFWACVYIVVTVWLALGKEEDAVGLDEPDMDVKKVYRVMWSIVQLKNIQSFLVVHLICKIGFQVNDSVTGLKLLEKGLSKEDLAVAVLLDFPAQMAAGWLAAKWSRSQTVTTRHPLSGTSSASVGSSLKPWIMAFWARLAMAAIATVVVWAFPTSGKVGNGYFGIVVATTLLASLTSTVQFVGITAFHTQIADPLIGGTYMTASPPPFLELYCWPKANHFYPDQLLNTVSNLGGTWPKPLILRSVDLLTKATCSTTKTECVTEVGKLACTAAHGICVIQRDGYYGMSAFCVILGGMLLVGFILPTVRRLQALPMSAWRVKIPN